MMSDLEAEVIKQEGEAAEGHLGGVDGHAASCPALGCYQVGIVWEPGVSRNRAIGVHHHLPWGPLHNPQQVCQAGRSRSEAIVMTYLENSDSRMAACCMNRTRPRLLSWMYMHSAAQVQRCYRCPL